MKPVVYTDAQCREVKEGADETLSSPIAGL
jgi:hypothetical protein